MIKFISQHSWLGLNCGICSLPSKKRSCKIISLYCLVKTDSPENDIEIDDIFRIISIEFWYAYLQNTKDLSEKLLFPMGK